MKTRILAAMFEAGILALIGIACLIKRFRSLPARPTVIAKP